MMLRSARTRAKPSAAVSRALATNATRIAATRSPAVATRTFAPRRNKRKIPFPYQMRPMRARPKLLGLRGGELGGVLGDHGIFSLWVHD